MSASTENLFAAFLNQHDDEAWDVIVASLLPYIHEVDRNATRIWFRFWPLALLRALDHAGDRAKLEQQLLLRGRWYLKDQIDTSHRFVYGHRYWPQVKAAITELATASAPPPTVDLPQLARQIASRVAHQCQVSDALTIGITAIGLMTFEQAGIEAFRAAPGAVHLSREHAARTPEQILKSRAKDDRQGILSLFQPDKVWSITFDENDPSARFKLINTQHLTTGAMYDKRVFHDKEPRCVPGEGPIPVECRSGACGTCWVGVLGGAEKLSPMAALERQRLAEFGYLETTEDRPLIRLACQAQANGAVSVVIAPWNGVFGRYLKRLAEGASGAEASTAYNE